MVGAIRNYMEEHPWQSAPHSKCVIQAEKVMYQCKIDNYHSAIELNNSPEVCSHIIFIFLYFIDDGLYR